MNQLILSHLDPPAWRAKLPGRGGGRRTIATIFSHVYNVRVSWLRNSAPHLKRPAPLDPHRCTMKQVPAAHRKRAAHCLRMLRESLSEDPNRHVKKFNRNGYAPRWPTRATMVAYMFSHEATIAAKF